MLNRTVLHGRLVRDPELRYTHSGVAVCSITVAWSDKYKDTETKCFLPVTVWRATAEMVARNFTKGREIIVEGQLQTRSWTDKDGNNRSTIELQADRIHFCGPKPAEGSNAAEDELPPEREQFEDDSDDGELPF